MKEFEGITTINDLENFCARYKQKVYYTETATDLTLVRNNPINLRSFPMSTEVSEMYEIYREKKKYVLFEIEGKTLALSVPNRPSELQVLKPGSEINIDLLAIWIYKSKEYLLWDTNGNDWGEWSFSDFGYSIYTPQAWWMGDKGGYRTIANITYIKGKECFQVTDCDERIYVALDGFINHCNERVGYRMFTESILNEHIRQELSL